jgi:hypothetical protein
MEGQGSEDRWAEAHKLGNILLHQAYSRRLKKVLRQLFYGADDIATCTGNSDC